MNDMQVGGDVVAEPELPGNAVTPLLGRALQDRVEDGIGHGVPGVDAVDKRRHDERADPPVRRQHEGLRVADPKHQRVAGADLQVIVGDRVAGLEPERAAVCDPIQEGAAKGIDRAVQRGRIRNTRRIGKALRPKLVERPRIEAWDDRPIDTYPGAPRAEKLPVAEQHLGADHVRPGRGQADVADAQIETRAGIDLEGGDIEPAVRERLRDVDERVGVPPRLAAEVQAVQDVAGGKQIPTGLAGENLAQSLRHAAGDDVGAGRLGALVGLVAETGDDVDGDPRSALRLIDLGAQPLDAGARGGCHPGLLFRLVHIGPRHLQRVQPHIKLSQLEPDAGIIAVEQ